MSSDQDKHSSSEDPTIPPEEQRADAPTLPPGDEPNPQEAPTVSPTEADTSLSEVERTPPLGTKVRYFGDYELLDEIARGGMGVVYKAQQISLKRIVALKMILAGQFAGESDVQRFHTEAEAAANLDHPCIVPIYEVGQHERQHYFSMGFVDGQSLAQKLVSGPLPPKEAAELARELAKAIAYAHGQGVIHRDLKPANVLLDSSGQPRITDFGVAKKLESESNLTGTGQILGTPSYMPPEQACGDTAEIGPAADVYALGAVLYAMLTGRPPFQAPNPMDTLLQVLDKEPVSPRQLDAGISRDLETICLKCLEKEQQRRYASADELAAELQRFLHGKPIQARPLGAASRGWRWCKRNPVVATLSASLVTILLILAIVGPLVAISQTNLANTNKELADNERDLKNEAQTARSDAEKQLRIAQRNLSASLAAQSVALRTSLPQKSVLLAAEAVNIWRGNKLPEVISAEQSLRDSVQNLGGHGLCGHEGWISSLAFSPDGRYVVTADDVEGMVRLWDLASDGLSQGPRVFEGDGNPVAVALSPDNHWLVTGNYDKAVRVWNLQAAEPEKTARLLRGHEGIVRTVAISPDSRFVVTGSEDKTARVWDLQAAEPEKTVRVLGGHEFGVMALAISPDGRFLATTGTRYLYKESDDPTVRLWDLQAPDPNKAPRILRGHKGPVVALVISPDGQYLVTGSHDKTARLWDLHAAEPEKTVRIFGSHERPVWAMTFSSDGRYLLTGSDLVRFWPLKLDELLQKAERAVGRNFTRQEWVETFPGEEYRKTFPGLPGLATGVPRAADASN